MTTTGRTVPTSAGDIWVDVLGPDREQQGPPLLLVHGFAGSTHWWGRVASDLATDHRVVLVDMLGHGRSGDSQTGYDTPAQARALAEVLDQLGLHDVVAIGHSLGAQVVIALAELDADPGHRRVGALVLVDQSPAGECATIPALNNVMVLPRVGAFLHHHSPTWAVRRALAMAFAPGFDQTGAFDDPDQPLRDTARMPHECYRQMQLGLPRFVDETPLDDRLRALGLPTLVVFGDRDQFHDADRSCARYEQVPRTEVVRIPASGHTPMLETPAEFRRPVSRFLDRLTPKPTQGDRS